MEQAYLSTLEKRMQYGDIQHLAEQPSETVEL